MKSAPKFLLTLLCLLCLSVPSQAAAVSLFDGKTLEGWEGETNSVWRVADGLIVGGSLEGNPQNEFLTTTKTYRNFILRLEYKLTGTEGFVNSGVQFRSKRITTPPNEISGYQADIGAGYSGCLYDESRRKTMLAKPDKDFVDSLEKPGDWNAYEIRAEEQHIQLFLNGKRTVDFTERENSIDMTGVIALQIHGKCKAEVFFRNITIEPLPDLLVPDEKQALQRFGDGDSAQPAKLKPFELGGFSPEKQETIVFAGPIKTAGQEHGNAAPFPMPPRELYAQQAADALPYARRSFGHRAAEFTAEDVKAVRSATSARSTFWTVSKLAR